MQDSLDLPGFQSLHLQHIPALWLLALGQQLHGAGTVTADGLQQIERIRRARVESRLEPIANPLAVWQKIVEVIPDRIAGDRGIRGHWQGQRQRSALRVGGPTFVVAETIPPAAYLLPGTDIAAVHP